jgi:hypothetical protein
MNAAKLQYCTKCGHLVGKVAPRCPKCGAPPYHEPKRGEFVSHRRLWAYVGLVVFLLFGVLLLRDKKPPTTPPVESAPRPSAAVAVASPEAAEASVLASPGSAASSVAAYEPPGLVDIPPEVASTSKLANPETRYPITRLTCDQYGAIAYAVTEDRDKGIPLEVEQQSDTLIKKGVSPDLLSWTNPSPSIFDSKAKTVRDDIMDLVFDIYAPPQPALIHGELVDLSKPLHEFSGSPEDNKNLITKLCEDKIHPSPAPTLPPPTRIKGFE